jgi:hypothetical protein
MQITIRKRTACIAVAGLVLLLGLAYPAVTFAATGTSTPPSTLNTCTKVNPRTHLYGKTKVSASSVCPTGEYAQNWISDNFYAWDEAINVAQPVTSGHKTFPAGDTVSFVNGSLSSNACTNVGGPLTAQLTAGGQVLAEWTNNGGPSSTGPPVTLSSPSDVSMAFSCPRFPFPPDLEFNVTFSVTPSVPSIPYS